MWLVEAKKLEIPWDKFKRLAFKGGYKIFQEEIKEKNEIIIYIYYKTRKLILILIINLEICL